MRTNKLVYCQTKCQCLLQAEHQFQTTPKIRLMGHDVFNDKLPPPRFVSIHVPLFYGQNSPA